MVGSEAVQALICQNVLYSRSLLRCAALREVDLCSCCPLINLPHSNDFQPPWHHRRDQLASCPNDCGRLTSLSRTVAEAQKL